MLTRISRIHEDKNGVEGKEQGIATQINSAAHLVVNNNNQKSLSISKEEDKISSDQFANVIENGESI